MAETEKKGPGRPRKEEAKRVPVKVEYEPIQEMIIDNSPKRIQIEGLEFNWLNEEKRNKRGWGIWRPVTRDSSLGQEVARQFQVSGEQFAGNNKSSNYFYLGPDTILAYTETTMREKVRAHKQELAERQINSMVGDGVTYNRKQHVINMDDPTGMKKQKK